MRDEASEDSLDQRDHALAVTPAQKGIAAHVRHDQIEPLVLLDVPAGTSVVLHLDAAHAPGDRSAMLVGAIDEAGAIRASQALGLPDGASVQLDLALRLTLHATVRHSGESSAFAIPPGDRGASAPIVPPLEARAPAAVGRAPRAQGWLAASLALPLGRRGIRALLTRRDLLVLGGVLLVYGLVRFIGLTRFPIYFFSDEAIQTNLGRELFQRGLRDAAGTFLPPYFRNVDKWNLSLSVYLQGLSAFLLGPSVLVTRATSAGVTLLAAVAVALTLRLVFRLRYWWTGALALSALPVWFIHSRTAFETAMMVSFYGCFVCAYLLYRYHDPRYLIAAIVFGAATFYSYANGQGVMAASGALLLLSDAGYHWRTLRSRPRLLAAAAVTLGLALVQYVRFRLLYPDALAEHLRVMNSVWLQDVPLLEKLRGYGAEYLLALSPRFWFAPANGVDLSRHVLKGWGNIPWPLAPLIAIGLVVCLRQWRSAAHRAVLVAVASAPFSAALAFIHNYRVLAMVIPAALLIAIGVETVAGWLERLRVRTPALIGGSALLLVGLNGAVLRSALVDGPTAYSDYGLYGMQYGSAQLFPAIVEELRAAPDASVVVSPDWANNPNAFVPFFVPEALRQRISFQAPDQYLTWKADLKPTTLYVVAPAEYDELRKSGKLILDPPFRVVPYPNGQPGFLFVRMRYVDTIDAMLAAERQARSGLIQEEATIDGEAVVVKHSLADLGSAADLFDDDPHTLLRGFEANPLVIELQFASPRPIQELGLDFWRVDLELTATVVPEDGGEPLTSTFTYRNQPESPHVDVQLADTPVVARSLRLELRDLNAKDIAKIHVPGIQLR